MPSQFQKIRKNKKAESAGFIALISVIITAAILLIIATALSLSSFYARYNALDSELKRVSGSLAEACIDEAVLKLVSDPAYNPVNEAVMVDSNTNKTCTITNIAVDGSNKVVNAEANYKNYFTILKVTVDPASDYALISWQEIP